MLERKPKMKNKTIKIKRNNPLQKLKKEAIKKMKSKTCKIKRNNPLQKTKKKVMKKMIMEKKRKMRVKKKTN
jgi:hypothetical protein